MLPGDVEQLFSKFSTIKVAVVGDVMLDTYWWGSVDRISPEAPVPVVALKTREQRLGGAANVALNLVALSAKTTIFSVVGNDSDGDLVEDLLKKEGIIAGYLVRSSDRTTTNKIRIMSRNQQMMRLDAEMVHDITEKEAGEVIAYFLHYISVDKPDVVVFEDYNKGVLSQQVIQQLLAICHQHNIITTVDPKRKNFFAYKGVTIFKPNLKEVYEGLNILSAEPALPFLSHIHTQLHQQLQHKISLITLSEKGIFWQQNDTSDLYQTHVRNIADVSGAGDTVIAVASLVYAATNNIQLASSMANIAGGLVCEEVGTVPINFEKLLQECKVLLSGFRH